MLNVVCRFFDRFFSSRTTINNHQFSALEFFFIAEKKVLISITVMHDVVNIWYQFNTFRKSRKSKFMTLLRHSHLHPTRYPLFLSFLQRNL